MEPLRFKIKKHRNNFTNRMIGIFLLIALLCSLLSGCSSETKKVSKEGFYFDTIITITLYGTDDEKYINDCFSLAKEYENKFSNTIKDSEISQINDADGKYVTVSDDTLELIQDGINYGKESDGKFDIAIGALSDLWNISEIAENSDSSDNEVDASVLPSNDDIKKSLAHIDYRSIEIKGNQVRLSDPGVKLDQRLHCRSDALLSARSGNHRRCDQSRWQRADTRRESKRRQLFHRYPETFCSKWDQSRSHQSKGCVCCILRHLRALLSYR